MDNASRIIEVDINDILPNRNQPRLILNEEDDLGLTDSVKEYGVLQPIIVRNIGDKYEIIAGERRYRASVLAGKETVPVIVRNMSDKESAEIALIENVQRKELTPIEEALSYKNILDLGYMTQEQLAEKIGKSQPTIANKIRLLNLTDEVQDALLENKISERHARSLLKIKNKKQQNEMLERIINERLTVRRTDEEISKLDLKEEIEKGEDKMNNNEFINMPQFESFTNTQPSAEPVSAEVPQANIFADVQPVAETVEATSQPSATAMPQIDIFANAKPVEPIAAPVEEAPQANIFTDVQPVAETIEAPQPSATAIPQFDIFANAKPVEPIAAPAEEAPQVNILAEAKEPELSQPTTEVAENFLPNSLADEEPVTKEFNIFAEQPAAPKLESAEPIVVPLSAVQAMEPELESAEPIVVPLSAVQAMEPETQSVSEPEIVTAPIREQAEELNEVKPEPIIVTDYNKQYDPIMPSAEPAPTPQADFKAVIAAIRECADKIESYGYKIDVDEFDLTNIYQAIFKIEKM